MSLEDSLYLYRIKLIRIIDADTFVVEIDKGYDEFARRRIRLAYVNAYESDTLLGKAAIEYVSSILSTDVHYFMRSIKDRSDSFGRYLGEIFLDAEGNDSLGDRLMHQGFAVSYRR